MSVDLDRDLSLEVEEVSLPKGETQELALEEALEFVPEGVAHKEILDVIQGLAQEGQGLYQEEEDRFQDKYLQVPEAA